MNKIPLEVLMSTDIKGYGKVYTFKQKGFDYENHPTKKIFGGILHPNTKTVYYDLNMDEDKTVKEFIRNLFREGYKGHLDITHKIVTDVAILAKFALIQNKLTYKTRAIVALNKLQKLIDSDIDQNSLENITNKLNEALNINVVC